ncbi:MAG: amidohydrolase family protein [Pseudolabrys sp.]|jgi:predicted TIM-barrel fold metal-dependent hydrolase|nr:amidohydrolase family protein [Pseudolabrys sp.]
MQTTRRIDTHHHFLPPFYLSEVGAEAIGRTLVSGRAPEWTPRHSIDAMDRNGIATAIVSISAPGFACDDAKKNDLCHRCNDYAAQMRGDHPGRFGSFAALPLPDIDASLAEIDRSLGSLGAEGICLLTNYDGRYLGDPLFEPVFEELNRRRAVVYVHPTESPCGCGVGLPPASLEFPFDTTRTVASLLFSGRLNRCRDIKFIFSHAGGTIPFLADRLARLERRPDYKQHVPDGVLAELKRLYYDTALSANRLSMTTLLGLVTARQVLFGSDYPYAPEDAMAGTVKGLNALNLPADDLTAIERTNALTLMPSLEAS